MAFDFSKRMKDIFKASVAVVLGTRPEAIKLAPVIAELRQHPAMFDVTVLSTGQHREMLAQVLEAFGLRPDVDLALMQPGQTLPDLTARVVVAMDAILSKTTYDMLLVEGDTTTVFAAALAAFYRGIPVGHVEAGLRSHDMKNPFPEEANRRLVSVLADVHFAPTFHAARELLSENIPAERIVVTGNTVVDALLHITSLPAPRLPEEFGPLERDLEGRRLVLMTSHRRESLGADQARICQAVCKILKDNPDVVVAYPVHLNPRVREVVVDSFSDCERVHLLPPLPYMDFVHMMKRSALILTDSGGVQEEAPTFGVPVLVLRKLTERLEAVQNGQSLVVGLDPEAIRSAANEILCGGALAERMRRVGNPFGDGHAAARIRLGLHRHLQGAAELLTAEESFGVAQWAPDAMNKSKRMSEASHDRTKPVC